MITIDFFEFIKEKKFGPIKLGDSKSFVIDTLGKPDGYSNPELFDGINYDRFEFTFTNSKLTQIANSNVLNWFSGWRFNRNFHYKNDQFEVKSWFKKPWIDTKLESFKKVLSLNNIEYEEMPFWDCMKIKIGNSLELLFTSAESHHKDQADWLKIDRQILNLRFSHFYLFDFELYTKLKEEINM